MNLTINAGFKLNNIKMEKRSSREKQPAEIEQIKEILFGSNIEDIENRFSSLESKIADETNHMLNTFREDLAKLRQSVEEEMAMIKKLVRDNQDRITEVENKSDQETNNILDRMEAHVKSWKEKNAEMDKGGNAQDKKIQQLQDTKLDTSRFVILIESILKKIKS